MIIGGNRSKLLSGYNCSLNSCLNSRNLKTRVSLNKNTKVNDASVFQDLQANKENICQIDPNSKSCKVVSLHLDKAIESKQKGTELELTSPNILNTTRDKKQKKVTFDVFTTPCPCVETAEEVLEKTDTSLCSPKVKKNVLDYAERIVEKYEEKNGEVVPKVSIEMDSSSPSDETKSVLDKVSTIIKANCTDEKCVIDNVMKDSYSENSVAAELEVQPLDNICYKPLKPTGPRTTTNWLSNDNTDEVLQGLVDEYPEFYFFRTTMTDFETGGDKFLGIANDKCLSNSYEVIPKLLDKGEETCFGCVINTDKTTNCKNGKCGTHWVCVFVDCRKSVGVPWTVEYFDSVGDPPSKEICKWQEKLANALTKYRNSKNENGGVICDANTIQHQEDNNECGVYCLYFLRARVEGIPFSRFLNKALPDYVMIEYRRHLFSK